MGSIGYIETSKRKYYSLLRNIPEERRSHLSVFILTSKLLVNSYYSFYLAEFHHTTHYKDNNNTFECVTKPT